MKKFSSLLIIFFILIVLPFTLQRCDFSKNEKTAKIEQLIDYCYNNGIFNGTILVAEHGKVIYNKAKGFANFETKERLNTDSPFYTSRLKFDLKISARPLPQLKPHGKRFFPVTRLNIPSLTNHLPIFIKAMQT